jgi:hypothetical protein
LAASLLGVAASDDSQARGLAWQGALDSLAWRIAQLGCSASKPVATLDLGLLWRAAPPDVVSVRLYPDRVRGQRPGLQATASIEFPALWLPVPLELRGAAVLRLSFDPVMAGCTASAEGP